MTKPLVAIQAAGGENIDIDALSTLDGSRRWRTTISGGEISKLFVWQQTVYLETDAPGGIVIRALSRTAPSAGPRPFLPATKQQRVFSRPGRCRQWRGVCQQRQQSTGARRHHRQAPLAGADFDTSETFLPPALMDGVLYDNAYSGRGPSSVYAFDPANGRELWQTAEFGPTPYSLNETIATEANGLVYFGSTDGSIYAVSARNGSVGVAVRR